MILKSHLVTFWKSLTGNLEFISLGLIGLLFPKFCMISTNFHLNIVDRVKWEWVFALVCVSYLEFRFQGTKLNEENKHLRAPNCKTIPYLVLSLESETLKYETHRDVTHCCSKNLKCLKNLKKHLFAYTFVHETVTEKTWIQVKTWRITSLFNISNP